MVRVTTTWVVSYISMGPDDDASLATTEKRRYTSRVV